MKTMKLVMLSAAFAGLMLAQGVAAPDEAVKLNESLKHLTDQGMQKKIFQIKYADPVDLANVLSVFGYGFKPNRDLHVIAVSAPSDVMTAVEDAIKRLDVPTAAAHDVDLTVYMLVASEQPAAGSVPTDLQPVVTELKRVFPYKGFRMLDSILVRAQPGNTAQSNGIVTAGLGKDEVRAQYNFSVRASTVTEDPKGRMIRLDNLNLNLRVAGMDAGVKTEITVREGQKVVVGKSNMGGTDQALILVVSAKVVD